MQYSLFRVLFKGFCDGISFQKTLKIIFYNPVVRETLMHCCLLNGFFFIGMDMLFHHVFLAIVNWLFAEKTLQNMMILIISKTLFILFWLVPVYFFNVLLSIQWFRDIANETHQFNIANLQKSRLTVPKKNLADKIEDAIMEFSSSIYMIILMSVSMVLQSFLFALFPKPLDHLFAVINLAVVTSWSSFEFKWAILDFPVAKRERIFEEHKTYFVGFGLAVSIIVNAIPRYPLNTATWSLLFPFMIIHAMSSKPLFYSHFGNEKRIYFHLLEFPKFITNFLIRNISPFCNFMIQMILRIVPHLVRIYKRAEKMFFVFWYLFALFLGTSEKQIKNPPC